jgi:hypothetical protein
MFDARIVVYLLYRKLLGDNIYKQWELGGVTVIRLDIDIWEIEGGRKRRNGKRGGWMQKRYGGCWVLWPL